MYNSRVVSYYKNFYNSYFFILLFPIFCLLKKLSSFLHTSIFIILAVKYKLLIVVISMMNIFFLSFSVEFKTGSLRISGGGWKGSEGIYFLTNQDYLVYNLR
jgi:hypothetical protein